MVSRKATPQLGRPVYLRPDTSDEQTWLDAFVYGYHVPPRIEPDAVLDLGANIGLTASHYAVLWPGVEVVAIEMDPENVKVCRRNFRGITVLLAVGAHEGEATYERGPWQASYSLLRPGDQHTLVRTIPQIIDLYLPGAERIFCKMDVEGTEWELLPKLDTRIRWLLVELHGEIPSSQMLGKAMRILKRRFSAVSAHRKHPHAVWAER